MSSLYSNKISRVQSTLATVSSVQTNSQGLLTTTSSNDLFQRIKGLIYLGKAIGIIPFDLFCGKQIKCSRQLPFWRMGYFISLCISILLGMNAVVYFIGMCRSSKNNAADLALTSSGWVFFSHGAFLYIYFLRQSDKFVQLFSKWSNLQLHAYLHDKSLSRDVGIVTGLIFMSAVMENLLLQFIQFPSFENELTNTTGHILTTYYHRSHPYWENLFSYHWFWAITGFIANKLALYAWNFTDILIAVLSRAISAKFRLLYENAERKLLIKGSHSISANLYDTSKKEDQIWIQLARDHTALCNLLGEFEWFLSPLIFYSYGVNIYYTCVQLFLGLTPDKDPPKDLHVKSTLKTIYTAWSFVHLLTRLYVVSISAAKINVHAHHLSRVLSKCPVDQYTSEVERVEQKVNTGPDIGLRGLGCFTITKPFILSIIGVVFTFEIVLLQSSP